MLATVQSATSTGATGAPVEVEVQVASGLPACTIIGLPGAACREARDRVRAAILSSGLAWPSRRVTVNLAPSELRKRGAALDLAIALGVLVASGALDPGLLEGCAFVGELGLDGALHPLRAVDGLVEAARGRTVVVPDASLGDVSALGGRTILGARLLSEVVDALEGRCSLRRREHRPAAPARSPGPDLAGVRGAGEARRGLEVAAAGLHHVLFVGAPASGKSLLASCVAGVLPRLAPEEVRSAARIRAQAGLAVEPELLAGAPPVRLPPPSASPSALLGGGSGTTVRPGEGSLASGGALVLDELDDFAPAVLEGIRRPLEEGTVDVARAAGTARFPARFLLVATVTPCPCGAPLAPGACRCTPGARLRHLRRVPRGLLDRFDVVVATEPPPVRGLGEPAPGEATAVVAARVAAARDRAGARGASNGALCGAQLDAAAPLAPAARHLLEARARAGVLSSQGILAVRRVARTLADLAGEGGRIGEERVDEAIALRRAALELVPPRRR